MKAYDHIKVIGYVVVRQGDKILARSRNHFVRWGLAGLVNFLFRAETMPYAGSQMDVRLGTNTATPTTISTDDLTAKIDVAPDTMEGTGYDLDNGNEAKYTATWNAGVITDTIGEAGLYLYFMADAVKKMFSRLSVADGDFYPFTPDPALPLTVEWYVRFMYA